MLFLVRLICYSVFAIWLLSKSNHYGIIFFPYYICIAIVAATIVMTQAHLTRYQTLMVMDADDIVIDKDKKQAYFRAVFLNDDPAISVIQSFPLFQNRYTEKNAKKWQGDPANSFTQFIGEPSDAFRDMYFFHGSEDDMEEYRGKPLSPLILFVPSTIATERTSNVQKDSPN